MKRILVAAFAAVTLLSGSAWAGPSAPIHMSYSQVGFRTQVAANPASQWDSLVTQRVGASGASSVLDTSLAISTEGWILPGSLGTTDSLAFLHVIVYDATGSGCESGADSLALAVQVSADGVTWASALTFKGGTAASTITSRNNQTIVSGVFLDDISVNGAALAAGAPIWSYKYRNRPATSLTGVDIGGLVLWPYLRFIISFHDPKAYKVAMKIGRFLGAEL